MQNEEFETIVLQCDKKCENETDYILCLSKCLQDRGLSGKEINQAIKYIATLELEKLKALFNKS